MFPQKFGTGERHKKSAPAGDYGQSAVFGRTKKRQRQRPKPEIRATGRAYCQDLCYRSPAKKLFYDSYIKAFPLEHRPFRSPKRRDCVSCPTARGGRQCSGRVPQMPRKGIFGYLCVRLEGQPTHQRRISQKRRLENIRFRFATPIAITLLVKNPAHVEQKAVISTTT